LRTTRRPIFENKNGLLRSFFILWALTPFANRLGAAAERVVAWGFGGTKSQTSNLSNQGTRGTIAKIKKEALGKTVPPTFIELRKDDVSFQNKKEKCPFVYDKKQKKKGKNKIIFFILSKFQSFGRPLRLIFYRRPCHK
jgi:hypothetical protein